MTAETLKPFITPTSANDGFPAKAASTATAQRRTRQMIPFVLGFIGLGLVVAILALTVSQPSKKPQSNAILIFKSLYKISCKDYIFKNGFYFFERLNMLIVLRKLRLMG